MGNLCYMFSVIYTYVFNKHSIVSIGRGSYLNSKEFLYILNNTNYYNNINTLLKWVLGVNKSQFDIVIESIPKKYKKKNKKKFLYKIQYLNKRRQVSKTLKWFYLIGYGFNTHTLKKRNVLNILDTLLNFKKSNLFLKKTTIYKNFLKIS